jgi:hypothetical protein
LLLLLLLLQFGGVDLPPESSALWFAGKALEPGSKLADYMGRNERSKVVVKLQKKGAGAPAREPVRALDEQAGLQRQHQLTYCCMTYKDVEHGPHDQEQVVEAAAAAAAAAAG